MDNAPTIQQAPPEAAPGSARGWLEAAAELARDNAAAAAAALLAGFRHHPESAALYRALRAAGHTDRALAAHVLARSDPAGSPARRHRAGHGPGFLISREAARMAARRRHWTLAGKFYRVALRFAPDDARLWLQLGHCLKQAGRNGQAGEQAALRAYLAAAALDRESANARRHLQEILIGLGQAALPVSLAPAWPEAAHMQRLNDPAAAWGDVNHITPLRRQILQRRLGLPEAAPALDLTRFIAGLAGIELVSFDLFDTLVLRRTGTPQSAFAVIAGRLAGTGIAPADFVGRRMAAETRARAAAGAREVTLDEILAELARAEALPAASLARLRELECAVEIELSVPNPAGMTLLQTARALGRRIVVASDTYLPRTVIECLLEKAGIEGLAGLFVSSELGCTKHAGSLFNHMQAVLALPVARLLHVGDNPHSDLAMARRQGWRALELRQHQPWEPVRRALRGPANAETAWSEIVGGLCAVEARLATPGAGAALARVGAEGLAPALLGFAHFVAAQARRHGYRRLFFIARDGFMLKAAYDRLRQRTPDLPRAEYLLASRPVLRRAMLHTTDDVLALAAIDHFPASAAHLLEERFRLDAAAQAEACRQAGLPPDILQRQQRADTVDPSWTALLRAAAPAALQQAAATRLAYTQYLRNHGFGEPGDCVVDIGYRGTTQRTLAALTSSKPGGLYFATWPAAAELQAHGLQFDSFLAIAADPSEMLVRHVQLLELLLSATHGTLRDMALRDGAVIPELATAALTPRTGATLRAIRQAALHMVDQALPLLPPLSAEPAPNGAACIAPLIGHFAAPDIAFAYGLAEHLVEDRFGGEQRWLVASPDRAERGCWAEGFARLTGWPEPALFPRERLEIDSIDGPEAPGACG